MVIQVLLDKTSEYCILERIRFIAAWNNFLACNCWKLNRSNRFWSGCTTSSRLLRICVSITYYHMLSCIVCLTYRLFHISPHVCMSHMCIVCLTYYHMCIVCLTYYHMCIVCLAHILPNMCIVCLTYYHISK